MMLFIKYFCPLTVQLIALPHENLSKEVDLGSSTLRKEKQKETNLKEIISTLEKRQSYEDAIGRSNEESMWVFQNTNPGTDFIIYALIILFYFVVFVLVLFSLFFVRLFASFNLFGFCLVWFSLFCVCLFD
jgi:hypothetical protein